MIDGIGGTEMINVYVSSAGKEVRPGAIGKAVPGYVAKVVDQDLNPVPNGTVGRLAVKGPTGCRYLDDERQKGFAQKGWNLPGDTFRMDADGYLDRKGVVRGKSVSVRVGLGGRRLLTKQTHIDASVAIKSDTG